MFFDGDSPFPGACACPRVQAQLRRGPPCRGLEPPHPEQEPPPDDRDERELGARSYAPRLLRAALSARTRGGLLLGVAVFSVGVVLGMVLSGIGLSYPIVRWGDAKVRRGGARGPPRRAS